MKRALAVALVIALAMTLGLCVRRYGFGLVRVTGSSMDDTLQSGDIAFVSRWDYARGALPRRGDVVECRFPGRADGYIKRVIGLPGERVTLSGGALTIDGKAVPERYVSSEAEDYAITLGEHEYLLLGDNRAESYDSRMADMGPVGPEDILGRARFILWPLNRLGPID